MTATSPNYATVLRGSDADNLRAEAESRTHEDFRASEADVEYLLGRDWRVSGGYIHNQAKVTDRRRRERGAHRQSTCRRVPTNRGSMQVAYNNPKLQMSRWPSSSSAFNKRRPERSVHSGGDAHGSRLRHQHHRGLPGYTAADLVVSRDLNQRFQLFFGAQNIANKVFFVQTNPSTVGAPRLVNFGVRVRFANR